MRAGNQYDLIVVGDQLSGYFLAAGAAQAGFKVLVVEGHVSPTAVYEVPSGNFLTDLSWEPLFGLQNGGPVDVFLKSLGLYGDAGELFPEVTPAVQLIGPDFRVDWNYDAESLKREWAREVPRHALGLSRLMEQGFKAQFKAENRLFSSWIADLGLPVWAERLGAAQVALFSSLCPERLFSSAYRLSLQRGTLGVRYLLGGKSALKERLVGRLQVFGGSVKRGAWAEEIVFERGELAGVLLSSFEGFVRSDRVVGAMGARRFLGLVPEAKRPGSLVREVSSLKPSHWRFHFSLHVPEEIIPEGLGQHFAYFDPDLELEEENFLQVSSVAKGVYSGIGVGQRVLLVRLLLPFEERCLDPLYIAGVLKRSWNNLQKILPFLSHENVRMVPDPNRLANDEIFVRYQKFDAISKIPPSLRVYGEIHDRYCERGVPMDWKAQGIEGLGLCSRDVHPLYGFYGEMLAAKQFLDKMIAERAARPKGPELRT